MRCGGYLGLALSVLFCTSPSLASKPAAEEFTVPLHASAPRFTPRSSERVRKITDELTGDTALQAKTAPAAIIAARVRRLAR